MKNATKKLYRSSDDYIIAGVCAGLGDYFSIDPIIFRIIFIVLTIGSGIGVLLYLVLMIVLPKKGKGEYSDDIRQKNAKEFVNDIKTGVKNISKEMKIENTALDFGFSSKKLII